MRKLLLFCLILTGFGSNAQTTVQHPFPTDSAAWYEIAYYGTNWDPSYYAYSKYYLNGDTLINGISYTKVNCKRKYYSDDFLQAIVKIDSNKVAVKYFNEYVDTNLHVIYDYNLQVGDSFQVLGLFGDYPIKFDCVAIDSALTNAGYRKQWNLKIRGQCMSMSSLDTLKWIEGTTSSLGLFYDLHFINCNATDYYDDNNTECFMHRDTFVLGGGLESCEALIAVGINETPIQPQTTIYPNPATNEFTILLNNPAQKLSVALYTITGQQVACYSAAGKQITIPRSNLPAGMYLVQVIADNKQSYQKIVLE